MRDADAHSCGNVRSLSNRGPKPQRTIGAQVNSVQPLVDLQCSRKPSRPSRQIHNFVGFAEPFHYVDSFQRLNGAQQHSCSNPRRLSRHVEHVGRTIDEVHIGKSLVQKQALVTSRSSAISMPTSIARWVSLCLDNTTANPVSPDLAHNGFPDEISGQLRRIAWQAGPRQPPDFASEMKRLLQWNTPILSARPTSSRNLHRGVIWKPPVLEICLELFTSSGVSSRGIL